MTAQRFCTIFQNRNTVLLSYGGDTDDQTNPFEVRLGKYVDLDVPDDVIGIKALRRIAEEGPKRHQLGVVLEDSDPGIPHGRWYDIMVDGRKVGDMTNGVLSFGLGKWIGFALVEVAATPGMQVVVEKDGRSIPGRLTELPFR